MDSNKTPKIIRELTKNIEKPTNGEQKKGGGLRFNEGKLRYDLEHPLARRDLVKVLTYGANKYTLYNEDGSIKEKGDRNWEKGMNWTTVIASAKRHLDALERGEDYDFDPECEGCKSGFCQTHSGQLHVSLLQTNAHFLNAYYYIYPQGDDRKKWYLNIPNVGLDIDGVLADWFGAWTKLYNIKETPYNWNFDRFITDKFDQMRKEGTLDEFYLNLKPLVNPKILKFEPHCYITSRPVSKEITEQWLDTMGFPTKPVYSLNIRESKLQAAKEAGVEIFVDDSYGNFVDLNNNGVTCYLRSTRQNERYNVGHLRINDLNDLPFLNY
jgi:hypothetical protein